MRIGIDARFFGPIGKGLGRYTEKLIQHLEGIDHEHEYRIFLRRENFDTYQPKNARFTKILAPFTWYTLQEQLAFPRVLARERLDLMHFPHFNVPVRYRGPFVVTIHDLILTRFPTQRATTLGPLTYAVKRLAYRFVIRSALKRARRILTVTQYSKRQILAHFPAIPDGKITVSYEGVDGLAQGKAHALPPGVSEPYLLYVGNAYPHKNLETLLEAFQQFLDDGGRAMLVFVGKSDYFYERLAAYASELGIADRIHFAGYVDDAALAALYRHAAVYVIPSLEEGFGLPPLEAMAHGVPVAASRVSCLPEVLGEGALYFDPKDRKDMAAALKRIFSDTVLRERLIRTAKTVVLPRYSWKSMAQEVKSLYESV